MRLAAIAGFRLIAHRPDRLLRFYEAIGFSIGGDAKIAGDEMAMLGLDGTGHRHAMTSGGIAIDLDWFGEAGRPYPASADSASRCLQHLALVTDDVERAWAIARGAGATPMSRDGPVTLPESAGGVTAVKFRDPEGHPLELIHFPDMVKRGWQGEGVLGVDHSAIVATDLARSQAFYEVMGLTTGDATLNHGDSQAALDGLDYPRVDVVPMQPADAPPHVELLHYRSPSTANSSPWAVNDVAATRIVWRGTAPALLRDPDGHLHQLTAA